MLGVKDILLGVVLPLVVSALLAGALSWKWRHLGGALAVAGGFVVGFVSVFGWPGVPPGNDFEWVMPGAILAGVVGTIAEAARFRWRWAWGVIVAAVAWLLVRSQLAGFELVLVVLAGWVWWGLWNEMVTRSPGAWAGMVMTGVAGLGSLVLMLSDSQRFGQIGLALFGAVAAVWIFGWAIRRQLWRGAGLVWGVVLYGLLVDGRYWAGLTWVNAGLLAVAPLLAWVGELPGVRGLTGWKRSAVRVAAAVVPVAVAVTLAVLEFQRSQQADGSEYY